ncbi:MAG: 4Fe-4S binding protein [Oscillospiraceae bacterium]|jgi:2-oxoglutarate ferredoxin oxidoreductase subunit delta|nr:4Fe-4S binding protein [Oscillospiraceae bacterium]
MPKIFVDENFCQGCELCVEACPRHIVALDSEKLTQKGYHPAACIDDEKCTGCAACAMMCPACAITVER